MPPLDPCAPWLADFLPAMALESALRTGVIAGLSAGRRSGLSPPLAAILIRSGVLDRTMALTQAFRAVWTDHGAELTSRLGFLRLAATDILLHGDALWFDLPTFMDRSRTFGFFDYGPALSLTAPSEATRAWVDYVSALTVAEAPRLMPHLTLPHAARVLEIGGNSGAFARALLEHHPRLQVSVIDLPGVCQIAMSDRRNRAFGPRLSFIAGDMQALDWRLAGGQVPDVILFKSVLHDWPQDIALDLLARALSEVAPGGSVILLERTAFTADTLGGLTMETVANAVFAPFYRAASVYVDHARHLHPGAQITLTDVTLDMTWHVVSISLPAA